MSGLDRRVIYFSLSDLPKQRWSFGFARGKKKRLLLPSLNSNWFTPSCIDFSCYWRSQRENWIGNCRNTLLFHFPSICIFSSPLLVFLEVRSIIDGKSSSCQDTWTTALTSLITLSSNAKGCVYPCGFRSSVCIYESPFSLLASDSPSVHVGMALLLQGGRGVIFCWFACLCILLVEKRWGREVKTE